MHQEKNHRAQESPREAHHVATITQERASESNAIQVPEISLPKGGGALKGIDEKFEVNAANGTASFSIPLPVTPGRNGFSPSLALSYNSGGGNSPYGLGWSVGYPMIQRKTDKRLPTYGAGEVEDVFMFSGAEDLVPILERGVNEWIENATDNDDYQIRQYRPRVESGFSRIERIYRKADGQTYWKVTTRENVATFFGLDPSARIADPEDSSKIFSWLPQFSYDDKGNWIKYTYKEENLVGVVNDLHERNRFSGLAPITNRYLKRVQYGNRVAWYAADPFSPTLPEPETEFFFELVMDYGEHKDPTEEDVIPTYSDDRNWEARADAFSTFRSGFEVRTYRKCYNILMFHHFGEERQFVGTPDEEDFGKEYLVRSLALTYANSSINGSGLAEVSYLASITQYGFIRKEGSYTSKFLPPMEFDYQRLEWNTEVRQVDRENIVNAPVGLTNNYQWVDLYGEGINGILTEQAEGWYYKSNHGDVDEDGQVQFTEAAKVMNKPSFVGVSTGVLALQDLGADGEKQVVVNSRGSQGYYELTEDNNYKPFQPFEAVANVDLRDRNTRILDLNGDGQAEIVISEEEAFCWYPSEGRKGYGKAHRTPKPSDEAAGASIVFEDNDLLKSIFLADMTGDGLTDIVRVGNNEICYWPNKGYGCFGAKVTMNNPPLFDYPDQFNPDYLQFADVSGTGATDVVYLGRNIFKAYINLSGNGWSDAHEIDPFFPIDSNTRLSVVDLLGTGTPCIVWSSDLPAESHAPMRYINLMNSRKPHLLRSYVNNLGKETSLEYRSSTYYYLQDKLEGRPWATKLPFPVHVIASSIVEEHITNVRFTTEYCYHHGYYDHQEREFRGFGMVEQRDTEAYAQWLTNNEGNALEHSEQLFQPTTLTKSWFHTGAFLDRERLLTQFEQDYWYQIYHRRFADEDILDVERAYRLPDALITANQTLNGLFDINSLSADEYREALRACKGMMLRQEVFALDAQSRIVEEQRARGYTEDDPEFVLFQQEARQQELKPFTVATHNCHIQLLQARDENPYAYFLVTESEALTIQYERDETDPRVAHTLNVAIDELGQVLEAAAVIYPRQNFSSLNQLRTTAEAANYERAGERDTYLAHLGDLRAAQSGLKITYTTNQFTDEWDEQAVYRLRVPCEVSTFELSNLTASGQLYTLADFEVVEAEGQNPSSGHQLRLIEQIRTLYYNDAFTDAMPFGRLSAHGITYESFQLAYTPILLGAIFGNRIDDAEALMAGEGKYGHFEGDENWWIRSGRPIFLRSEAGENAADVRLRFYSPLAFQSPFGSETKVFYYKDYYLMLLASEDALENRMEVERFNFRSLSPIRTKDMNDNLSEVLLDELGLVKAVAVLGKGAEADTLAGLTEFRTEVEDVRIQSYFSLSATTDMREAARALLVGASVRFVYNFHRYRDSVQLREEQLAANSDIISCTQINFLPTVVGSIRRERHYVIERESPIQLAFEYSDGSGNIAMTKSQAEGGNALRLDIEADCSYELSTIPTGEGLRWLGNGRTVLNNKGNPVKQYEPYFSVTPFYEDHKELIERGVTPIIYYDALGRTVRTELPDGTFTRVAFDAWQQRFYDQNDTVMDSRWYRERIGGLIDEELIAAGKHPAKERAASQQAALHHNTPNVLHLDNLGRPVMSVAHNIIGTEAEWYSTFIELDIEGNTIRVLDARNNAVMSYAYNMLGQRVYQNSAEASEKWVLNNVAGNAIRQWDSKDHTFLTSYDALQRPTSVRLRNRADSDPNLIERLVYGERQTFDKDLNLRGSLFQHYDSSGRVTNAVFDFKGNALRVQKQLADAIQAEVVDWAAGSSTNGLEEEVFIQEQEYDALNRMTRLYNWHRNPGQVSVYIPTYNARGLLQSEAHITDADKANVANTGRRITAVSNIEYNEKGQRLRMRYGNGTNTRYHYDRETFRLIQLKTTRSGTSNNLPASPSNLSDDDVFQNLYYTYDAAGNIIEVEDDAYEPVFFRNQRVEPRSQYTYDALYRLIQASGRENFTGGNRAPNAEEPTALSHDFPRSDRALRNYNQSYSYDAVGNILRMRHVADGGGWTRNYQYATNSNRLLATEEGSALSYSLYTDTPTLDIRYDYDVHGNMLNYNQAPSEYRPDWDYQDRVHHLNLGGGGDAYYQYDNSRERSHKRIVTGGFVEERIYLGGTERYRRWGAGGTLVEEIETHHLFVDNQRILMVENVRQTDSNNLATGILDRYQYSNHLGSVGLELNTDQAIISYEEYHPYGTVAYHASNSAVRSAAKRYRYTGMERDSESGLNYHSARYYMPWLGRWLKADPINIGGGINFLSYSLDNPINFLDKSGLQSIDAGTTDDPVVMGCIGSDCYLNIRQSKFDELKRRAQARRDVNTLGNISGGILGALAYLIADIFTDDPNKLNAASSMGAAGDAMSLAVAGVGRRVSPQQTLPRRSLNVQRSIDSRSIDSVSPSTRHGTAHASSNGVTRSRVSQPKVERVSRFSRKPGSPASKKNDSPSPRDPNRDRSREVQQEFSEAQARGGDASKLAPLGVRPRGPLQRSPQHHLIPREFVRNHPSIARLLESRGINIDHFTVRTRGQGEHSAIHSVGYNRRWADFFRKNPNATRRQILGFMHSLRKIYRVQDLPVERYEGQKTKSR